MDKNAESNVQTDIKEIQQTTIQQTTIQQTQQPLKNTGKPNKVKSLNPLDSANHLGGAKPISDLIKTSDNKQNNSLNLTKTTLLLKQADSLSEKVVLEKTMPPSV